MPSEEIGESVFFNNIKLGLILNNFSLLIAYKL